MVKWECLPPPLLENLTVCPSLVNHLYVMTNQIFYWSSIWCQFDVNLTSLNLMYMVLCQINVNLISIHWCKIFLKSQNLDQTLLLNWRHINISFRLKFRPKNCYFIKTRGGLRILVRCGQKFLGTQKQKSGT